MEAQQGALPEPIDLTREMDVMFWCRVFDLSAEQLREAVHHAGHQPAEIRRYLSSRGEQPSA
jgi:hypothetical protein